jgi:A/G-specific adenine glycosylase
MKFSPLTTASRPALRAALLDHYDRCGRDLPWRRDTDPYRVLVSEVMLQQTRVETAQRYYEPWLDRFPTVGDLAIADEEDVLKLWEGLGYYRRARNLHAAARVLREECGGAVPDSYSNLLRLPGIGEYTAGAIASIAFGERVPAVDGNVRRVLSRLLDVAEPGPAWLREQARELVDPDRPGDWNQALMELGATVCTPRRPECASCPVGQWCAARNASTVTERPGARKKRPVPAAAIAIAVLHRRGEVLLVKRPDDGLLAGMWAFPEVRLGDPDEPDLRDRVNLVQPVVRLARSLGARPIGDPVSLPTVRHRFSHLTASYLPVAVEVHDGVFMAHETLANGVCWIEPARAVASLAVPVAQGKILNSWAALSAAGSHTEGS